jgi:glycosyltransferase involved in cell wall biosynthesis
MKEKKICYFLKNGRETRLDNKCPDEFLYGFGLFKKLDLNVSLIIDSELGLNINSKYKLLSIINMIIYWLIGIPGKALCSIFLKRKIFIKYDIIIVTTNTYGLCLALLKKCRLLKSKIFFISMGLVDDSTPFPWIIIYRLILKDCKVVTLSYQDSKFLQKKLKIDIEYINFGVDKDFWLPQKKTFVKNYVISIGNDLNRDYKTLIQAWKCDFPLLKIITNHKIKTNKKNIEIIFGDWSSSVLSDKEIRQLIIESLFVVLPISQTIQPSGQSVSLQSMSCAKTVLITDFNGLWNRELMRTNETCLLAGKPGEIKKLEEAIINLIENKTILNKIGNNARKVIENNLNSYQMANQIYNKIEVCIMKHTLKKN